MPRKYPKIVDQSGYLAKILIVDEIGLSVSDLISGLLGEGYLVYLLSKNNLADERLLQNHNLYLVSPKDVASLSLIDYLVVIQKPVANNEVVLSNFPKSYRTIIFRQWNSKVKELDELDKSIQTIFYEEIIDPNIPNKLDQLIQLRKEGTNIVLNKESNYYPINSQTISNTISYLITNPPLANSYRLTSGMYSWQALIGQINKNIKAKIRKSVSLDIPNLPVGSNLSSLEIDVNMDLFIKNKITTPVSLIATIQPTSQPKHNHTPTPPKHTDKVIKIYPKIHGPNITKPLLRLLIILLIPINFLAITGLYLEKAVINNLNNYQHIFTAKPLTVSAINDFTKQSKRITLWQTTPLSWLLLPRTNEKILPMVTIEAVSSWLYGKQAQEILTNTLVSKWLSGETIILSDWDSLLTSYKQQIPKTVDLTRLIKQNSKLDLTSTVLKDDLTIIEGLANYQQEQTKLLSFTEVLQTLITDKPIRLLVLLQNSYELRPTGGLVSAYGLLTLQNGQKPILHFYDSSVLDNKMTGRIQPPVELTNQLGENRWFFRDINWEPDLALSADRAIWYYETAEKAVIDGLLITNSKFWLSVNQSLNGNKTTEDKFFTDLVTESASQKDTLSSAPFLADFANQTFDQLTNTSTTNTLKSVEVLKYFEEKDLALSLKDSQVQTLLAKLGWDGKVKQFVKPESKTEIIADYIMVNEANTGVNLVNRYVTRKIEHDINFTNGNKSSTVKLIYSNGSPISTWPGGNYQAYVRLFLPKSVSLRSIMLNRGNGLIAITSDKINGSQYEDKAVFGFRIDVHLGETVTYQIDYTDRGFIGDTKVGTYLLLVQKQPGLDIQRYQLSITSDKLLTPLRSIPDGQIANNAISIISDIKKDTIFQVDFGQ